MKQLLEILSIIIVTIIFYSAAGGHPLASVMSFVGMLLAAIYLLGCEILHKLNEISKNG